MSYVKTLNQVQKLKPHFLTIGAKTRFGKILSEIKKSKNIDFVWVKRTKNEQMAAVLIARLIGKKFVWIQNFSNPPSPSFLTRFLLSQADRIIVTSHHDATKLKTLGIGKGKIKRQKES